MIYTVAGIRDDISRASEILRTADERGLIEWHDSPAANGSLGFVYSPDGKRFVTCRLLPSDYQVAIELKRRDGKVELIAYHDRHQQGRGAVHLRSSMRAGAVKEFLRAWNAQLSEVAS